MAANDFRTPFYDIASSVNQALLHVSTLIEKKEKQIFYTPVLHYRLRTASLSNRRDLMRMDLMYILNRASRVIMVFCELTNRDGTVKAFNGLPVDKSSAFDATYKLSSRFGQTPRVLYRLFIFICDFLLFFASRFYH